jgi:hypothetical protein
MECDSNFVSYEVAKDMAELKITRTCIGMRYPDGELVVGSEAYIRIMLKKCPEAVPCPMKSQAVAWLGEPLGLDFTIDKALKQFKERKS